ncbi:MAG: 50S ribosomal protein L24 [Candidatus Micrarchaeota archaeon]
MKSDTERKKYYSEKLHKRKNRMHVHLSKDLRSRLKAKRRALLVRKGDSVRIMRGPGKGKEAKVGDVNTTRRVVFAEGIAAKNSKGREIPIALQPSNLLLISLEPTAERKEMFSEEAFKKKEAPKKEAPKEEKKGEAQKTEHKHEPAHEQKPQGMKSEYKAQEAKAEKHGPSHSMESSKAPAHSAKPKIR